ncbi:Nonribosomal peptide synthetase chry1 [Trichinella spiralis]|uniref:Nonribosomal peptide synthetase chry1 n=1 Tax=Trichinella spiralis TaxID=6334 RepID=A0ABR3KMA8_TRISP
MIYEMVLCRKSLLENIERCQSRSKKVEDFIALFKSTFEIIFYLTTLHSVCQRVPILIEANLLQTTPILFDSYSS